MSRRGAPRAKFKSYKELTPGLEVAARRFPEGEWEPAFVVAVCPWIVAGRRGKRVQLQFAGYDLRYRSIDDVRKA